MSGIPTALMELRDPTADWPGDRDDDFLVRWTDAGWAELVRRGLRPEMRLWMDVDATVFLIDLNDRQKQRPPFKLRRARSTAAKGIKTARTGVAEIHQALGVSDIRRAQGAIDIPWDESLEILKALNSLVEKFARGFEVPDTKYRRSREVFFDFAEWLYLVTDLCGIPLVRSKASYDLVDFILKTIAPFAEEYFVTLAGLDRKRAEAIAHEIRQQSAKTLVRHAREQARGGPTATS